jgi:membrane protease YdiL (CAAX protease family)
MPDKKIKKTRTHPANGALFIAMALVGMFVHFTVPLYNWLTLLVLLAVTIYFYLLQRPLFGPSIFLGMVFLTNMLPFVFARLGLFYIIPLGVYAILMRIFPSIRRQSRWFYVGRVDRFTWVGGLAIAILSALGLYLWTIIARPNLSDLVALIPHQSLAVLIFVGLGFAVVNSFVEEAIYRGILWTALGKVFGSFLAVTLLQSAIFGIAHLHGFPRGATGVAMAFVYGIMLGAVRQRSEGLLPPMIVHFVADMVLFMILLKMMGRL